MPSFCDFQRGIPECQTPLCSFEKLSLCVHSSVLSFKKQSSKTKASLDHDQLVPANPVRKALSITERAVFAFNCTPLGYIFRRVPVHALKMLLMSMTPLYWIVAVALLLSPGELRGGMRAWASRARWSSHPLQLCLQHMICLRCLWMFQKSGVVSVKKPQKKSSISSWHLYHWNFPSRSRSLKPIFGVFSLWWQM